MRSFYISFIIICILILIWFSIYNIIDNLSNQLTGYLNELEKKINKEDWPETQVIFSDIEKTWKDKLKVLMLVIDHEEMEKINLSLSRIEIYILIKDKSLILGEIANLKFFVDHIREKESLSLKNILWYFLYIFWL